MPKKDKDKKKDPPGIIKPFTDRFKPKEKEKGEDGETVKTTKIEAPKKEVTFSDTPKLENKPADKKQIVEIRDKDTGEVTGLELPDGRILLGLNKADIETFQGKGEFISQEQRKQQEALLEDRAEALPAAEEFFKNQDFPTQTPNLVSGLNTISGQLQAQAEIARKRQSAIDYIRQDLNESELENLTRWGKEGNFTLIDRFLQSKLGSIAIDLGSRAVVATKAVGEILNVPFASDVIDGILGDNEEVVQNLQSSLEARNQMASKIADLVSEQSLTPREGQKALESLKVQLDFTISQIQQAAITSPAVRRSGQLEDLETDLLELQQEIFAAEDSINRGVITGTYDPNLVSLRIKELKEMNV